MGYLTEKKQPHKAVLWKKAGSLQFKAFAILGAVLHQTFTGFF